MDLLNSMPFLFYPASVALFQLHWGMVSHMQVLATPSSTENNTKYLDPYMSLQLFRYEIQIG